MPGGLRTREAKRPGGQEESRGRPKSREFLMGKAGESEEKVKIKQMKRVEGFEGHSVMTSFRGLGDQNS